MTDAKKPRYRAATSRVTISVRLITRIFVRPGFADFVVLIGGRVLCSETAGWTLCLGEERLDRVDHRRNHRIAAHRSTGQLPNDPLHRVAASFPRHVDCTKCAGKSDSVPKQISNVQNKTLPRIFVDEAELWNRGRRRHDDCGR